MVLSLSHMSEGSKNYVEMYQNQSWEDFLCSINDSHEFAPALDSVCNSITNRMKLISFLMKFYKDPVPPNLARWYVKKLTDLIGSDQSKITKFSNAMLNNLEDPGLAARSLEVIYAACVQESDLFRLDDSFGVVQSFTIYSDDRSKLTFSLGFHPFHSTRRIYMAVAGRFDISFGTFLLNFHNDANKTLSECGPLPQSIFNTEKSAEFDISIVPDSEEVALSPPLFLSNLSKRQHFNSIFSLLKDYNSLSFRAIQVLSLLQVPDELPEPGSQLQAVLCQSAESIYPILEHLQFLPYIIVSSPKFISRLSQEESLAFLRKFDEFSFDTVSLRIILSCFTSIAPQLILPTDLIKKCLIGSHSEQLRTAVVSLIPEDVDPAPYLSLLPSTILHANRSNTAQFFSLVAKFKISYEVFLKLLSDCDQFELNGFFETDQTFISIVSILPRNPATLSKVASLLFAPPSTSFLTSPFIHSDEAWTAALSFLSTPESLEYIIPFTSFFSYIPALHNFISEDCIYMGRTGISNLGSTCYVNSILQALNSLPLFYTSLMELPPSTPYLKELKNTLAMLRYIRGDEISAKSLVDTFNNFDENLQEDVEEFFTRLVNRIHDEAKQENVTVHLQGTMTNRIETEQQVVSESKEDFFYLSLPTKGFSDLMESFSKYFEDEQIGYQLGENQISAKRHMYVSKWPTYLTLQLQRWEYTPKTKERSKLVNEFSFPLKLKVGDSPQYELCSVVIHKGGAESGHYLTIVNGRDGEWYVCNDSKVEFFELSELPSWAFGEIDPDDSSDDSRSTAYLLFYSEVGTEIPKINLSSELEQRINEKMAKIWPNVVLSSPQFVDFSRKLYENNPSNDNCAKLALPVFFRIASKSEKEFSKFGQVIEQCDVIKIFGFIASNFKSDFVLICTKYLEEFLMKMFKKTLESTKPLTVILSVSGEDSKFAIDAIVFAMEKLNVDWTNEDEALMDIIKFLLSSTLERKEAIKGFLRIITSVVEKKGATAIVKYIFNREIIDSIKAIIKKDDSLLALNEAVFKVDPSLLADGIRAQLSPSDPRPPDSEDSLKLGVLWECFPLLIFSEKSEIKSSVYSMAIKVLPPLTKEVTVFCEKGGERPKYSEDSAFALYMLSLLPRMAHEIGHGSEGSCDTLAQIIERISFVLPRATELSIHPLIAAIPKITSGFLIERVSVIIRNLLVYNNSFYDELSETEKEDLLSINGWSKEGIQILRILACKASNSILSSACVEHFMNEPMTKCGETLCDVIRDGLTPGRINVAKSAKSLANLLMFNALWDRIPDQRAELARYGLNILKMARPKAIYLKCPAVREALNDLEGFDAEALHRIYE